MVRRLLANWELKLLSVVIAFALWLVVVGGGKSQLAVAAVVEYTGLDGDLVLVGRPRDTVDVELEAARWAVTRLTPGAVRVRASLSGMREGENVVALSPDLVQTPPGVVVRRVTPARLQVRLAGGVANEEPLTPDLAFRVGRQLVATLALEHGTDRVRLVIGRDTRLSGPLLEAALVAGLLSAGAECYAAGVLPTPAIALLTKKLGAHGGIVLSASHNLFEDNGIKLFSSEGTKFPDAWENAIEQRLQGDDSAPRARGARIGRLIAHTRAEAEYVEFLCGCFPLDLSGLTIALDCAHGATYRVAPRVFRRLGARVLTIGTRPDGTNINAESGALHPERLQRMVRAKRASVGFAF